jgi:hypothetical protein
LRSPGKLYNPARFRNFSRPPGLPQIAAADVQEQLAGKWNGILYYFTANVYPLVYPWGCLSLTHWHHAPFSETDNNLKTPARKKEYADSIARNIISRSTVPVAVFDGRQRSLRIFKDGNIVEP